MSGGQKRRLQLLLLLLSERYLLERVTDQQHAIVDGRLRSLPGGVDEYLRVRADRQNPAAAAPRQAPADAVAVLAGSELRAAQKQLVSVERRIGILQPRIDGARVALSDHDPSDYVGLGRAVEAITALKAELQGLEDCWLDLSERIDAVEAA